MKPEAGLQKVFGTIIDFQELFWSVSEFSIHLLEICELLEVIGCELHFALLDSFIDTFTENVSGVSVKVLVELDGDKTVPGDEAADIGDFEVDVGPC